MYQLMIAAAKMLPEEVLIEKLEESLSEYKILKTEDSKKSLTMFANLLLTRLITEGSDLADVIKEFDSAKGAIELFKKSKQ